MLNVAAGGALIAFMRADGARGPLVSVALAGHAAQEADRAGLGAVVALDGELAGCDHPARVLAHGLLAVRLGDGQPRQPRAEVGAETGLGRDGAGSSTTGVTREGWRQDRRAGVATPITTLMQGVQDEGRETDARTRRFVTDFSTRPV